VRVQVRVSLLVLVVSALVAALGPGTAQAAFGVEKFFAGNCNETHKECNKVANPSPEPKKAKEEEVKKAEEEGFTQAAGHPNWGITDFTVSNVEIAPGVKIPFNGTELVKVNHVRTDVAPGVSTNPQAVPKCSTHDYGVEVAPGAEVFEEPTCPTSTELGTNKVVVVGPAGDQTLEGAVYNLEQAPGDASLFGVALEFPKAFAEEIFKGTGLEGASKAIPLFAHTLIEGGVEYATDYHDFFEIKVSELLPLLSSRLTFKGNIGGPALGAPTGAFFLTSGTTCTGPGPQTTTSIAIETGNGEVGHASFESPIGGSGCDLIPFAPTFLLTPETTTSDQPDGITVKVATTHPETIDSSDLRTAVVKLPEGMTMNPSAAAGLEGCTPAQIGIGTRNETKCPPGSRIGSFALEVPGLPSQSLKGSIYLGKPESGSITGPPYTVYLDAESTKYNVKVRLKGTVEPNPTNGQLTTTFAENPEQPFTEAILHFDGGMFAPIANPLVCSEGVATASFTPFSGFNTPAPTGLPFTTKECASPAFAPKQTTTSLPKAGGSESNFEFKLERPEGQQYVSKISTLLPPGLVGKIPSVTQCTDAQAAATQESGNGCPASSQVGTVQVASGSGSPFTFSGNVYLTEKINGAPYGLAFKVPVEAGPFKFTEEVTIATINVNQRTAQVTVAVTLPTIKDGIPIRVRSMTVDVNRPNYILNPTNCGEFQTESTVTPVTGPGAANGTAVLVKSPFQAEGCSALAFKPTLGASTSGKANKANGASLVTTMTQAPGQSNIKSVLVQLPKQLPSRLTTLQKACLAATFEQNPYSCAKESFVGTASAVTPVLPNVMTGPAILVSHAGEEFPSLELVLEADNVRVIVEGKTHIKSGITTTNFASTPDVPVSSITVSLPLGPFSALAVERTEGPKKTNLCTEKLVMPTTITGQNGVVVKQQTIIAPTQCGVQILKTKVKGDTASVTIETYAAGTVRLHGVDLTTTDKTYTGVKKSVTIKVPLSRKGRQRRRAFKLTLKVSFTPKQKGGPGSSASTAVKFPR
jgi:hypothetical protein